MTDSSHSAKTWVIVVGGGRGDRFGEPKQFSVLDETTGERVIDRAVAVARSAADGVTVVVPAAAVAAEGPDAVAGGVTRSQSVRAGLAHVPDSVTVVCVHDAARPLATLELYRRVIAAVRDGAAGAVPAVPVTDTIKQVDAAGWVVATPRRSELVAVQTPQAFAADALRAAHANDVEGSDDGVLVEATGRRVQVVPGEPTNLKITLPTDLDVAQRLGAHHGGQPMSSPARLPVTPRSIGFRVGQGFDIHRFSDQSDRRLILGGCEFEGEPGLVGHSDADVVAHAAADALLGAAGLGDIGQYFPDTDPQWKGADSLAILQAVTALVRAAGFVVGNIDVKLVCERPKVAPRKDEMERNLSAVVGAPVTVAGRRAEGLGALGRTEGIAAWAVAIVAVGSGEAL